MKRLFIPMILFILLLQACFSGPKNATQFKVEPHSIIISNHTETLTISLDCPLFTFEDEVSGGYPPLKISGDLTQSAKDTLIVSYSPVLLKSGGTLDVQLLIKLSADNLLLHKWIRYRHSGTDGTLLIKEIVLEKLGKHALTEVNSNLPGQSYPVFFDGFFAGIEFPVSSVRIDSGLLLLAHQPGIRMAPGRWYESSKAVYGVSKNGEEREAFLSYIESNRPENKGFHINYNSWWTSPMPYSEKNILELMKTFREKLYEPYGVTFNSFCIDMGWSDPKSIWQIDTLLFPEEFNSIRKAAEKMKSNLGLWVSPSNRYSPSSIDSKWAEKNGYETYIDTSRSSHVCCLAGENYGTSFREQLVRMVEKFGIIQLKFDGYLFFCPDSGHGHEPGYLSMEATAESLIKTCEQIHKVSPETWIETTCMGWNPSPWWLFYANSVLGTHGDDSPAGRIPCPVFRESYTTARDFYNIQGATYLLTPVSAQEVLGIIHQTPESFSNDAITTIMRGHFFLPVYLNPAFMNDRKWKMIAQILSWGRNNSEILKNSKIILPESWKNGKVPKFKEEAVMPREPYGYSHINKDRGLIELRNPWIKNYEYHLKIDSSTGFSKDSKEIDILSVYPESRIYGQGIDYGDEVNIPLAPYETLILSISKDKSVKTLSASREFSHGFGRVSIDKIEKKPINTDGTNSSHKKIMTVKNTNKPHCIRLQMECSVEVLSPQADLLLLIEGKDDTIKPSGEIFINGKSVEYQISGSAGGWTATMFKKQEHWIFVKAAMVTGKNMVSMNFDIPGSDQNISVWAWARKPGDYGQEKNQDTLPQPEEISLESVNLVKSFSSDSVSVSVR